MTIFTKLSTFQAGAASRLGNNVSVFLIETVASFAKNTLSQLDRMTLSSTPIFIMRDGLKMFGIDAMAHSANMIYFKAIRDFSLKHLVGEPVNPGSDISTFAKIPIAFGVYKSCPKPTAGSFIDVFKKSFFRCLCPAHRTVDAMDTFVSQLFNKVVPYVA
jgi:hypothetical protein